MRVRLDRRSPHGTTATVLLPAGLLCELPETAWSGSQTVVMPAAEPARQPQPPVPAVRPAPRPRHAAGATTIGGLPRRTPSASSSSTGSRTVTRPPEPKDLIEPGQTVNGLPRRVSRSIKNPDHGEDSTPPSPPAGPDDERNGHEQLLADLDAFTEGEQAAKAAQWPAGADPDAPPAEPAPPVPPPHGADPTEGPKP
jgi:hypothetical protein